MKSQKKSVPPAPELTNDEQLVPEISVPYDPTQKRSPDAVSDSIFHEDIPRPVVDILKTMILQEDEARVKNGTKAVYNPVWNILLQHMNATHRRVDGLLAPLEFDYEPGRPMMVVKLGNDAKGWIPNAQHFDKVRKFIKAAGVDKHKNVLLFHYALQIEHHAA